MFSQSDGGAPGEAYQGFSDFGLAKFQTGQLTDQTVLNCQVQEGLDHLRDQSLAILETIFSREITHW